MRLSLNHPVRLFVDANTDVAGNLRQEFVRVRSLKEGDREALVTGEQVRVEGGGGAVSWLTLCESRTGNWSGTLSLCGC